MIDATKREELKAAALNALPHEGRDHGDQCDAEFALKLLLTPEVILTLLGEEIPELPIPEQEIEE